METHGSVSAGQPVLILADDEWLIRATMAETLAVAGFDVREADNSAKALAMLQNGAHAIHGLFTDVHMPGAMNGLELAHHVRGHWPWVALLIASGQARPTEAEMPAGARFLGKPYEPSHVVRHLRELVAISTDISYRKT